MAESVIREWRLSVLRVQLDLSTRTPFVAVSMVLFDGETPRTLWQQRHTPEAFGVPVFGPPEALVLPEELVEAVRGSFERELPRETALWLRLMPPYGFLGAAPWEERLVPVLDRPVLRVPDRLPVAADFGAVWTAVVAISARPDSAWAAAYVSAFLESLHAAVVEQLDVHVFADARTAVQLQEAKAPQDWWHVHHPEVRRTPSVTRTAWSEWIRSGLSGRAVRSLHVVTDAAFDGDQPMLLVTPEPALPDPTGAAFVPVEAALRLTDTLGAATLSFGSPPDNLSDVATRMMADQVGQHRPGPTLYSSIEQDPDGRGLADAHAYLADRSGELVLPWHHSLFFYVQPEHVRTSLAQTWPEPEPALISAADGLIGAHPDEAEDVPAWVAASYRFIEDAQTRMVRSSVAAERGADEGAAYDQGVVDALEELRALVDGQRGT